MGEVFGAFDPRLDRRVALKRIRSSSDSLDSKARERFLREAQAVAQLSHPSIVQVHDLLEQDDEIWLVMELVEGANLSQRLRQGPLPIPEVLQLGREIAAGLDHAHRQGIIHRDLKGENVMVTPEGHAKILDFGIAKRLPSGGAENPATPLTADGTVVGTHHAMSPEQARGLEIDHRSDLFSLGVLLYEMTSARAPFLGATPLDTLHRICTHQPRPLQGVVAEIPEALDQLVGQLLQKEPARRTPSAAEASARLSSAASAGDLRGDASRRPPAEPAQPTLPDSPHFALAREVHPSTETQESPRPLRGGAWRWLLLGSAGAAFVFLLTLLLNPPWLPSGLQRWTSAQDPNSEQHSGQHSGKAAAEESALVANSPPPETNPFDPAELSELSMAELHQRGQQHLAAFYRPDDLAAAIAHFDQILEREPTSSAAYAGLSRAFWHRFRVENTDSTWLQRAVSHGQRAVELDPYLTQGRVSLALAQIYSGRLEEAEEQIAQADRLDPGHADVYRARGELESARDQLEASIATLGEAVELRPEDFELHDVLGVVLWRQGDLEAAAEVFQRAIQLAPDCVPTYRNLAGVYHFLNQPAEASRWMQKALAIRPDPTLYGSLGVLYFDQGLYRESAEAFEAAIDFPNGGNDYRIWANLADAYRWAPGRKDQANGAYKRAIDLLKNKGIADAEERSRLALMLAKRGDREQALAELGAFSEVEVQGPSISYRLAVAWEILGKRQQALDQLEKALQQGLPRDIPQKDPELLALRSDASYHHTVSTPSPE
ncbi:MAG: protein kinase [Acidobacteriota bacterium]